VTGGSTRHCLPAALARRRGAGDCTLSAWVWWAATARSTSSHVKNGGHRRRDRTVLSVPLPGWRLPFVIRARVVEGHRHATEGYPRHRHRLRLVVGLWSIAASMAAGWCDAVGGRRAFGCYPAVIGTATGKWPGDCAVRIFRARWAAGMTGPPSASRAFIAVLDRGFHGIGAAC